MESLWSSAALAGVLTHQCLFIRGEWEKHAPVIAGTYAALPLMMLASCLTLGEFGLGQAVAKVIILCAGYAIGIFGSIAIYRLFFHPIRNIPGPFWAKLTGWWSVYVSLPSYKFHRQVQGLHGKYGDFVRIRPREISINNADAVKDIHGPGTVCIRGPFYDLNYPFRSLQLTRDKSFHSKRRRLWDKGFTRTALKEYEPRLQEHCKVLISQLAAANEQPVEITHWLIYYGFDVMGDLIFGKSFSMLKDGKAHFILKRMEEMKPVSGILVCVSWTFNLLQSLPVVSKQRLDWLKWCASQVNERKRAASSRVDLFSHILGSEVQEEPEDNIGDLVLDSELAVSAGSETTSSTLAAAMFLLARHPDKQKLLQEEIDQLKQNPSAEQLATSPVLEGCICEALRLYPAAPSGLQRVTPAEGAMIAGRHIPGNTLVSTPTYTIHRDPRNFVQPNDFLPERWSSQPELILRKDAFNPFLIGSYSCVGKALALLEMRTLLTSLAHSFSWRLAGKQEDTKQNIFEENPGVQDYFVAKIPEYDLVFEKRRIVS